MRASIVGSTVSLCLAVAGVPAGAGAAPGRPVPPEGAAAAGEPAPGDAAEGAAVAGESEAAAAPCPVARDEDALSAARELFDAGVGYYEGGEYDEAIHAWYEALSLVRRTSQNRKVRAELIYNVARAEEKAFDIDHDIRRLRRAKRALERFTEEVAAVYPRDEVARERAAAGERIAAIERKIEKAEAEARRREQARIEAMRPKFDPVLDRKVARRNRGMMATGGALFVLGAGALGMMGAGLAIGRAAEADLGELPAGADLEKRRAVLSRGDLGNRLAIAGAVTGGVLVVVGLPLLIAGGVFEKERKAYKASFVAVPHAGPGGIGLRFGRP